MTYPMAEGAHETCGCCGNTDAPHHMTRCRKCKRNMCPRCLYLPRVTSPTLCADCRKIVAASIGYITPPEFRPTEKDNAKLAKERATDAAPWATRCAEIIADATRDRREAAINSVAFGHAEGRIEAARQILAARVEHA